MDLNITFLKTFNHLDKSGSFTETAKQLNMTQPGVSQHVKWLEDYFQKKLVKRVGRTFEFTLEGKKVLSYAKDIFEGHDQFLKTFQEDNPYSGECKFASPGSFGISMYSFLLKYNKKYPNLSIKYSYAPNTTIEKELLEGNIDMGFMEYKPKNPLLNSTSINQERLCLIAPTNLKDTTFEGLLKLGFIHHPDGPSQAEKLLSLNFPKQFKGMDKIKVTGGNNQISRILEPVALGLGFTVLPEFACLSFPNQKHIKYIKLAKEIKHNIYLVQRKHEELPKRFQEIIKCYKENKNK